MSDRFIASTADFVRVREEIIDEARSLGISLNSGKIVETLIDSYRKIRRMDRFRLNVLAHRLQTNIEGVWKAYTVRTIRQREAHAFANRYINPFN